VTNHPTPPIPRLVSIDRRQILLRTVDVEKLIEEDHDAVVEKRMSRRPAGLKICVISAVLLIVTQVHGQKPSLPDASRHLSIMVLH